MRVLPVSDLHFEHHADDGASLLGDLDKNVDVAIVAGDLANAPGLFDALSRFAREFARVVFVPGNHDWFHGSREKMAEIRRRVERELEGVSWLDRDAVEIEGQRFVGATLWFPDSKNARRWRMNMPDFQLIEGLAEWVHDEFERSRAFLRDTIEPGDIVITHHLPTRKSVADRWVNAPLNCYFVGNVEDIVRERGARWWIHGHTHDSCDYMFGRTRVLCNPFGHPAAPNRQFRERLIVGL